MPYCELYMPDTLEACNLFLFNEANLYSLIMAVSFIIIVLSEFYYLYVIKVNGADVKFEAGEDGVTFPTNGGDIVAEVQFSSDNDRGLKGFYVYLFYLNPV